MDINENEIEFIINYKLKNTAFIDVFHLPLIYRSTIRVHHMILFIGMLYILLLVSLKDIISINRQSDTGSYQSVVHQIHDISDKNTCQTFSTRLKSQIKSQTSDYILRRAYVFTNN